MRRDPLEERRELEDFLAQAGCDPWSEVDRREECFRDLQRFLTTRRNLRLSLDALRRQTSLTTTADWLYRTADRHYHPLVCLSDRTSSDRRLPRLVCAHALTGQPSIYRSLAQALDGKMEVWGFRARGSNPGESNHQEFAALFDCYASA
ncbi:MAG: hypothetical protein RIC87_10105 [Kiloniellales bacterium]